MRQRKPTRPEDAVQSGLKELARDIAIIEPDPSDWSWWVCYLLEELEFHARKRRLIYNYEDAIVILIDKIKTRIQGGRR